MNKKVSGAKKPSPNRTPDVVKNMPVNKKDTKDVLGNLKVVRPTKVDPALIDLLDRGR